MPEPYLGEVRLFPFGFVPRGWLPADGRLLKIREHQALSSLYGTVFGGDGKTTFGLPDLAGRTPIHASAKHPRGQAGGVAEVTLTVAQIPSHQHAVTATTTLASLGPAAGSRIAQVKPDDLNPPNARPLYGAASGQRVPLAAGAIETAGVGQPHENHQPFAVLTPCVAVVGEYPPRP